VPFLWPDGTLSGKPLYADGFIRQPVCNVGTDAMRKQGLMQVKVFFIISCLFLPNVFAHQPRLVGNETNIVVDQPEISKAYYGSLSGKPATYRIESTESFRLYVNILVPDIEGIDKDVSVKILKHGTVISILDGIEHDWTQFYEPFAGDHYFRGSEYIQEQDAGTYEIEVYSPDNQGKYVLAIGDREAFPLGELVRTYVVLPRLKSEIFGKSPFSAYFNIMGIFLAVILVIAGVILITVFYSIKLIRKRNRQKLSQKAIIL